MDYRDNRQRWAESHQVVHFYAGQWCTFTPALTLLQQNHRMHHKSPLLTPFPFLLRLPTPLTLHVHTTPSSCPLPLATPRSPPPAAHSAYTRRTLSLQAPPPPLRIHRYAPSFAATSPRHAEDGASPMFDDNRLAKSTSLCVRLSSPSSHSPNVCCAHRLVSRSTCLDPRPPSLVESFDLIGHSPFSSITSYRCD